MKSKILFIGVSICLMILLTIGVSYSYWKSNLVGDEANSINSSCFSLSLSNEENAINLENTYPITSSEGKALVPYTFTITNTCKLTSSYTVNLAMDSTTTLNSKYLAVMLNDNNNKLLSEYDINTIEGYSEARILDTGYLASNESKSYSLRIWLDESVTLEDDVLSKVFSSKIVIVGEVYNKSTKLSDQILLNNPSKGTADLTATPTDDTSGIYEAEDDFGTSYYFRGTKDSTNNHVIFAGFCWQIIRINGDGAIRVIYNGTPTNGKCTTNNEIIGSSAFNGSVDDNAYVGYMYGVAGSDDYDATHANSNDSTIKGVIDDWYSNNLISYSSYISDSGFCNDRGVSSGSGFGTNDAEYKSYARVASTTPAPELKCNQNNDFFTIDTIETKTDGITGNKALKYPIGLITADEAIYSGLFWWGGTKNTDVWLENTSNFYWIMSPSFVSGSIGREFNVGTYGVLCSDGLNTEKGGVRPVISLAAEISISQGDGSVDNPFTVDTNKNVYNFDYTGSERTFTVPVSGTYKIETWGAQGGSYSSNVIGGYGGYSVGQVSLEKGDVLYINVGGSGQSTGCLSLAISYGGYNGGGNGINHKSHDDSCSSSGGGATSVSTIAGLLSTLSSSTDTILIVAGGGGGAGYQSHDSDTYYMVSSGSGGGYIGVRGVSSYKTVLLYSSGGTQTGAGIEGEIYGSNGLGSFGLGSNGVDESPGGGGGFYGGNSQRFSAGGGSGYIGNSLLTNKVMYCYNCSESSDESTKTISTANVSSTPISNYAKIGNGYARITLIS